MTSDSPSTPAPDATPRAAPPTGRRMLVVQLARFGDLLQIRRLVLSLAAAGAEVHLAVDRSLAGLAGRAFPDAVVHGLVAHGSGVSAGAEVVTANLPVLASLRRLDFERVYNLNYSGLNFALASLFEPGVVRGYRYAQGQHLRDKWPELAMRWSRFRRRAGLNLVDFWGLLADAPVAPGEVNPIASPKGGGVGVVLAGRHSRRSLRPEALAAMAGAILAGTGFKGLKLLGTKSERPLARALEDALPGPLRDQVENLAGATSMDDLFDVVGSLDLLLTPDTGTMHLAAMLGTPITALFTASAWAFETGPYGLGHRVWQAQADCLPCLETGDCHMDLACHKPFAGRDFLRHLAGNPEFEHPQGLLGLASALDSLGQTYHVVMGNDADAARRRDFRALVGDWAGLNAAGPVMPEPSGEALASGFLTDLFQERDWILPGGSRYDNDLESI